MKKGIGLVMLAVGVIALIVGKFASTVDYVGAIAIAVIGAVLLFSSGSSDSSSSQSTQPPQPAQQPARVISFQQEDRSPGAYTLTVTRKMQLQGAGGKLMAQIDGAQTWELWGGKSLSTALSQGTHQLVFWDSMIGKGRQAVFTLNIVRDTDLEVQMNTLGMFPKVTLLEGETVLATSGMERH